MMSESKYDSVKKKELSDQELHDINCSSDFTDTCDYGLLQESVLGLYTTMQEFASHPIFKSHVQNEAFKMIDIDNQLKTRNRDLTEDHAIIFAGETGAGKSTVINLLINEEEDVLPVDITATTSRLCKILNCDPMVILTKNHENKTIEERKFQSHEKSNMISSLRDLVRTDDPKVRSINICHPVPIQQGKRNIILLDTPGVGNKKQDEVVKMMMEYLPNSVALIFIINIGNAGGFQNDSLRGFLAEMRESMFQMPCFEPQNAIFLLNKWDTLIPNRWENDLFDQMKRKTHEIWKDVDDRNIFKFAAGRVTQNKMYKDELEKFKSVLKEMMERNESKRVKEHLEFIRKFTKRCKIAISSKLEHAREKLKENETTCDIVSKALEDMKKTKDKISSNIKQKTVEHLELAANKLFDYVHTREFERKILRKIEHVANMDTIKGLDDRIERELCSWEHENIELILKKYIHYVKKEFINIYTVMQEKLKNESIGFIFPLDVEKIFSSASPLLQRSKEIAKAVASHFLNNMFLVFPNLVTAGILVGREIPRLMELRNQHDYDPRIKQAYMTRISVYKKEDIKESFCTKYEEHFRNTLHRFFEEDLKDLIKNFEEQTQHLEMKVKELKSQERALDSLRSTLSEIKTNLKEIEGIYLKFN